MERLGFGNIPDMIIVDGGKGQLTSAKEVLRELNLENIDIGELLEISLETQQINANKTNINFITNIEENIFTFIDEIMILRAFNNIISNAIFYGKENGFLKISLKKENNKNIKVKYLIS